MKTKIKINSMKINELVGRKKLTQEALSNIMDITRATLSINLNKESVNYDFAENLAKALGVSLDEIEDKTVSFDPYSSYNEIMDSIKKMYIEKDEIIKRQSMTIENLSSMLFNQMGKLEDFREMPFEGNNIKKLHTVESLERLLSNSKIDAPAVA
jgi:transcriptional regulator with XRE-family HTH domain